MQVSSRRVYLVLTPAEYVVSPLTAALLVAVWVRGVRDDYVQVERLVHQPRERREEEVVEHDRHDVAQQLQKTPNSHSWVQI